MAPARRARSPTGETDQESEPETPRPHKNGLKKRVSEVYHLDNDGTFNADSSNGGGSGPRPPLRTVNINDDVAEKRRRRKSTKLAVVDNVNALAGPSSEGGMQQDQQQHQPDGNGAEGSRTGTKQKPLKTVAAPIINVSMDVMSSNFEEWMKMATDNKINAQNSWNFALIDYFHDMSLLRNKDDNSINFQRASFTLDGCVKIWTSRVDSVGTETGKLLGNLESGGKVDDDEGAENSDNPDADPTETGKKRKKTSSGNTLVKDPSQLKNKKLDLEFAVDPLFKKTCADFDEGGASGLLMNHLSLGIGSEGCMRVVFDASDPMGQLEDEEPVQEPEDDLDLSFLRANFFTDLSVLEEKAISHSLADFAFGKELFNFDMTHNNMYADNTKTFDDNDASSDDDNDNFGMNIDGPGGDEPQVEDFFIGADAVNDDFGGDMIGGDDFGGDNDTSRNGSAGHSEELEDGQTRPGPFVPFDPRRLPNSRDLTLAMADPDAEGALDYFDNAFLKNWAGPEHWRLRKPFRKPEGAAAAPDGTKSNKRQKKDPVKIDFTTPHEKDMKELIGELFAPATGKGAGIDLPGTKTSTSKTSKKNKEKLMENKDDHRLPDDMHFSSRQLVTLFLKPKFFLRMRGRRVRMNDNGDGEVDEKFLAQAAADQVANRNLDDDGDDSNEQAPFSTQFFHDDGFDDDVGYDGEGGPSGPDAHIDEGEQDLLAATQGQTRRVKPEFVKYTKRAKRVDVRKLKDNIWKGLHIVIEKDEKEKPLDQDMDVDEPPTDPNEARQFSQVISGLQKTYPKDKMEEISTSFCFICLLHLANEQGLKLESAIEGLHGKEPGLVDEMKDEVLVSEKKIGDIWDIKIYRDPDATQSA